MRPRFTIRDLLWLTVVAAGVVALFGALAQEMNTTHPISETFRARQSWSAIIGYTFIIVGAIGWYFERKRQ